jgi:hypothetical protein
MKIRCIVSIIIMLGFKILAQAQETNLSVFLGTRDKYINIYANPVGNRVVDSVIEDSSQDEYNVIIIKDQAALRFLVDLYTVDGDKVTGWIDKVHCAVYVGTYNKLWHLYVEPSVESKCTIFESEEIDLKTGSLTVIDYKYLSVPESNHVKRWVKIGFMYKDAYYEGWSDEICSDINHACH